MPTDTAALSPAPRWSFSLATRFVAACLLLVSISTAGYYYAVSRFIAFLEAELRDTTLLDELHEFADAFEQDPRTPPPHSAGIDAYVLHAGEDPSVLPARLRNLGPGVHGEIHLEGHEVAVAREDVHGARLLVALDMEPIEELERRFVRLAWVCALASWIAAVVLALWLARRVMQPVTQLAAAVDDWRPGDTGMRLSAQFGGREIGVIAAAFDRYVERTEAFVAREQAFTEDSSHELRTPLTVIDSAAQLLAADGALAAGAQERVQRIQRAVRQIQVVTETLLFLAREEGGVSAENLDLHALANEFAASRRDQLGARPIEIVVEGGPAMILAPRGMAACVVDNLLANAVHFTERGRVTLRVEPGLLSVQDTGVGIPPADLDRIFERRFRGQGSGGLGLGLYLVRRICDRLGWRVDVSSEPGAGTRFDVHFLKSE